MRADLRQGRELVDQLPVPEHRDLQLGRRVIFKNFSLPCMFGIKQLDGSAVVDGFIMDADQVRLRLAGVPAAQTVDLFEMRRGDLPHVLADLDLGDDRPVFILNGAQLVDASEHGIALGCDQAFPDPERVDLRALPDQLPDEVLVQRVGDDDLALRPARVVQHPADLLRQIGDVAGVDADAALSDPARRKDLIECADRVRDTRFQHIVGIDQQGRVLRIDLAVRPERLVFAVKHLDPGMRHGAGGGNAVDLVGNGAGGCSATADIRRARPENGGVGSLRSTGTELADDPALGRAGKPCRLGRDERLMVQHHQHIGLDELRLDRSCADGQERFPRKNDRPFRDCPDVARKVKSAQIGQKLLGKISLSAEEIEVLLGEFQIADIVHDLFESGDDRKAAVVGIFAVKDIKIDDFVLHPLCKIAVAHGQLVKIAEHGQIAGKVFHKACLRNRLISLLSIISHFSGKSNPFFSKKGFFSAKDVFLKKTSCFSGKQTV